MAYMAIETTFLRGSRIKAQAMAPRSDGKRESVTVNYAHALNSEELHAAAALHLLPKVCSPDGVYLEAGATEHGYVFVIVRSETTSLTRWLTLSQEVK